MFSFSYFYYTILYTEHEVVDKTFNVYVYCSQSFAVKSTWSPVSLNLQVPNTWLWWIWTRDWELCFAQKVEEREREKKAQHCNWAWNTFVRCMTFKQMVKVSLYAANMLHFLISCFLLIYLAAFSSICVSKHLFILKSKFRCLTVYCLTYQCTFSTTLQQQNILLHTNAEYNLHNNYTTETL